MSSGVSDARVRRNLRKWLAKAYSKATKPEEFKAIANLAELLELKEEP